MAVKQKHVERVTPNDGELQTILRALQDLTTQGFQDKAACQKTIAQLGTIHVPKDPNKYKHFIKTIQCVQEILTNECIKYEMITTALRTLYNEISNAEKSPSPVMSIVLQLIDDKKIPNAVEYILLQGYSSQRLKQSLLTLCNWLTKWTWTENLGPLVHYYLQEIGQQQQYFDIVVEITGEVIKPYFKLLILPEHRKCIGPIVLYMLSVPIRRNPEIFNKIVNDLPRVLSYLNKENSESSCTYLRDIVNSCVYLIYNYPEFPNLYHKVMSMLEVYLPVTSNKKTLSNGYWVTETSVIEKYSSSGKVGLNNLGNTCYMNSVLQALFMTKFFRNYMLLHNKELAPHLAKLQNLFALLQYSRRSSMSPTEFSNLARPPGFLPGHQHDSSEFLGYLLEILHEQENTVLTDSSSHCTMVQTAFGGCTVTVSQCDICHTRSERVDNFWELQLSIPSNSEEQSVQTLVNYYLQPEKLHGDNQYHCDVCDCLTDGDRLTCIRQPPPRLILTLKHFR